MNNKTNKKARKRNRGFSLVELIIVIAIMAILAGVLAPQFIKYIGTSKKSSDIQNAQNAYDAISAQVADGATLTTGSKTEITDAVASSLNMGSKAPTSKVNSAYKYYYLVSGDSVSIYIGSSGTNHEVAPSIDTGSEWAK